MRSVIFTFFPSLSLARSFARSISVSIRFFSSLSWLMLLLFSDREKKLTERNAVQNKRMSGMKQKCCGLYLKSQKQTNTYYDQDSLETRNISKLIHTFNVYNHIYWIWTRFCSNALIVYVCMCLCAFFLPLVSAKIIHWHDSRKLQSRLIKWAQKWDKSQDTRVSYHGNKYY